VLEDLFPKCCLNLLIPYHHLLSHYPRTVICKNMAVIVASTIFNVPPPFDEDGKGKTN